MNFLQLIQQQLLFSFSFLASVNILKRKTMTSVKFDKNTKIWSHCGDPLLYNANISMAHILLRSMELHASKIAQVSHKLSLN